MPKAADLFHRAFIQEKKQLRTLRQQLHQQLDEDEDRYIAEHGDDADLYDMPESSDAKSLRAKIRHSKLACSEYLNNEGVTEMRMGYLKTARRLFERALRLTPDSVNAKDNLKESKELIKRKNHRDATKKKKKKRSNKRKNKKKSKKSKSKKSSSNKTDAEVYDRPAKRRPQRDIVTDNPDLPRPKVPTALDRVRRPNTNPREKLPRVHIKHLDLPENAPYKNGEQPFILLGAMEDWSYERHWAPEVFAKLDPNSIVDFYPHNMDKLNVRPFLTPFAKALDQQLHPTHAYPVSDSHPGSYIQWNVNYADWKEIYANMNLPAIFRQDTRWLIDTSPDCFDNTALQQEFILRTHWRMVLIGNRVRRATHTNTNSRINQTVEELYRSKYSIIYSCFFLFFSPLLGCWYVQSSRCASNFLLPSSSCWC